MLDDQVFALIVDRLQKLEHLLERTYAQTVKTNGHVGDHERRIATLEKAEAVAEAAHEVEQRERRDRRWTIRELLIGGSFILAAGFGPDLIRLLF